MAMKKLFSSKAILPRFIGNPGSVDLGYRAVRYGNFNGLIVQTSGYSAPIIYASSEKKHAPLFLIKRK